MTSNLSETPNNQQHAAEVIYGALSGQYGDFRLPTDAAQALADAGLLMPELPEPDKISTEVNHTGRPWMEWGDNQVSLVGNHIDVPRQFEMDADETRELAYYLLAAAEHMEKNT